MTKARDLANSAAAFSAVSATELGYVDGVTSAIQTQLDAKQASSTAVTLTGTQTLTNKTLTNPVISSVINNTLTTTTGDIIYASGANTPARLGIGSTGQVLTVASGAPSWATPATSTQKVIQVVTFSTTTVTSTSSTSLVDTNITLNITPTLNTSKVLILSSVYCAVTQLSVNQVGMGVVLKRGTTTIFDASSGNGEGFYMTTSYTGNHQYQAVQTINYVDSPATTSATTYKIQIQARSASATANTSTNNNTSTITLLEIGA